MTQRQVAEAALIGAQQYQEYEYDKKEPGVRMAVRLAKALNTTVEELYPPEE